MMGSFHEPKKDRIAVFEPVKAQLYPRAEAQKKRAKRRNKN